ERQVGIDANGKLVFTVAPEPLAHFDKLLPPQIRAAADGAILEWRADTSAIEVGRRVMDGGGAALIIDYGHEERSIGETLQAVGRHAFADPLSTPGEIDLTAHVDFQALAQAIESTGARTCGPIMQSQLLRRLGIQTRAATLKANAGPEGAAAIDGALARLIGFGRSAMGDLFKALGVAHPKLEKLPGFDS
ncbi:MAG: SAM-dependent methyltransferase, partial [Acidobacteriota bacterium]